MILRIYLPDECDTNGNPLDWLACRECKSKGLLASRTPGAQMVHACPSCDGHGSLHAAALVSLRYRQWDSAGGIEGTNTTLAKHIARCEDCQHPMSEGTWEGDDALVGCEQDLVIAKAMLDQGREPTTILTHYSRCDEKCNHGGPVRLLRDHAPPIYLPDQRPITPDWIVVHAPVEAPWRPVNIRRLSSPMDLRPETLTILCLRCWAVHPQKRAIRD